MILRVFQNGYMLWLSRKDTEQWATRPDSYWPCSTLRGKAVYISVDNNGLCDFTINGRRNYNVDYSGWELQAIVSDYTTRTKAGKYWPCWE